MVEYITKSQAIDLAESLRPIAGNGITDAFIKGIEGLEGHWMQFFEPKVRADYIGCDENECWYRTPKEE